MQRLRLGLTILAISMSHLLFSQANYAVKSSYGPISNELTINYTVSFANSLELFNDELSLPDVFTLISLEKDQTKSSFVAGEQLNVQLKLAVNTDDLPFYRQVVKVSHVLAEGRRLDVEAHVYFDPSNHVEVIGNDSSDDLRVWDIDNGVQEERVFVAKDDFPKSDLTFQEYNEMNSDDLVFITTPGFAYSLPMKKSLVNSAQRTNGTQGYYSGKVTGRLVRTVNGKKEPLFGVRLELRDTDWGFGVPWKTTYSKSDGTFELDFGRNQTWEWGRIQFRLFIDDQNYPYGIRFEKTERESIKLSGVAKNNQYFTENMGDIELEKPYYIYSNVCRAAYTMFQHGVGVDGSNFKNWQKGRIVENSSQCGTESCYDSHLDLPWPQGSGKMINISGSDFDNEDIHYKMYGYFYYDSRFQMTSWYGKDHGYGARISDVRAITGGIATFVAALTDQQFYHLDNERGTFDGYHEYEPSCEHLIDADVPGARVELAIANALWDLYDGPNNTPYQNYGPADQATNPTWNDEYYELGQVHSWDDVEYSVSQILHDDVAIRDSPGRYIEYFLPFANSNRTAEAKIGEVFRRNGVSCLASLHNEKAYSLASYSTGDIYEYFGYDGFDITANDGTLWERQDWIPMLYDRNKAGHKVIDESIGHRYIQDPVTVVGNMPNFKEAVRFLQLSAEAFQYQRKYTTTGYGDIDVFTDGRFDVGEFDDKRAHLTVSSGNYLQVHNEGLLKVAENSKLTIETGATLILRDGAEIDIQGEVEIKSGAYVCIEGAVDIINGDMSNFTASGHQGRIHDKFVDTDRVYESVDVPNNKINYIACAGGLEELFPSSQDVSALSIVENYGPRCSDGAYSYSLQNASSLPWNVPVYWQTPAGWLASTNSKWGFQGTAYGTWNPNIEEGIESAEIYAVVQFPDGYAKVGPFTTNEIKPLSISMNVGSDLLLCGSGHQAIVATAGQSDPNNIWQWSGTWALNASISSTNSKSTLDFNLGQSTHDYANVRVTLSNNVTGCPSVSKTVNVTMNKAGWQSAPIWTGGTTQHKALNKTNKFANITTDREGNLYYVGDDNRIYTYNYNGSAWENYAIPATAPITDAAGPINVTGSSVNYKYAGITYTTLSGEVKYIGSVDWKTQYSTITGPNALTTTNPSTVVFAAPEGSLTRSSVIYSDNGKLYKYDGTPIKNANNQHVSATGQSIAIEGNYYYYRNQSGYLGRYNTTNGVETNYGWNSALDADAPLLGTDVGQVWFSQWGTMKYLDVATGSIVNTGYYNASKQFGVNRATGIVYMVTWQGMVQLFNDHGHFWNTNALAKVNLGGSILFDSPNVFYTDNSGYIYDVFYLLNACAPAILRTKGGDGMLTNATYQYPDAPLEPENDVTGPTLAEELIVGESGLTPNPATNFTQVNYSVKTDAQITLIMYSIEGAEVMSRDLGYQSTGDNFETLSFDFAPGVYLIKIDADGELIFNEKLVIE